MPVVREDNTLITHVYQVFILSVFDNLINVAGVVPPQQGVTGLPARLSVFQGAAACVTG